MRQFYIAEYIYFAKISQVLYWFLMHSQFFTDFVRFSPKICKKHEGLIVPFVIFMLIKQSDKFLQVCRISG